MRRNRKDNAKKERIIMIASSVFVLTALTMTGVYMQSRDKESENDGYTIDFSALENSADDKSREIAGNDLSQERDVLEDYVDNTVNTEDDLDYMPMEAGSNLVEIPGLTDGDSEEKPDAADNKAPAKSPEPAESPEPAGSAAPAEDPAEPAETPGGEQTAQADIPEEPVAVEEVAQEPEPLAAEGGEQEAIGENVVNPELHFAESDGLLQPIPGQIVTLIPFSREVGVYFQTLDHYKRSYATVLSAAEGTVVSACAEGQVVDVFENEEIGNAVTMELGDGYRITYGQLKNIQAAVGSHISAGEAFAMVAAPTKYYVREGSNLYLKLTHNDTPIDPSGLMQTDAVAEE